MGIIESDKKHVTSYVAGLKLIAKARSLLESHFLESDSPFNIFLAFAYHAEGRVIQKYVEEKMDDLAFDVPALPNYEEDESDDEEEKEDNP